MQSENAMLSRAQQQVLEKLPLAASRIHSITLAALLRRGFVSLAGSQVRVTKAGAATLFWVKHNNYLSWQHSLRVARGWKC